MADLPGPDALAALSPWAVTAYAARTSRRVLPLVATAPSPPAGPHLVAVGVAVSLAEEFAEQSVAWSAAAAAAARGHADEAAEAARLAGAAAADFAAQAAAESARTAERAFTAVSVAYAAGQPGAAFDEQHVESTLTALRTAAVWVGEAAAGATESAGGTRLLEAASWADYHRLSEVSPSGREAAVPGGVFDAVWPAGEPDWYPAAAAELRTAAAAAGEAELIRRIRQAAPGVIAQEITFTPHARREMARDEVSEDAVRGVITDPGHVGPANHPNPTRRRFWKGGVNVILEPNPFFITVVTVYTD